MSLIRDFFIWLEEHQIGILTTIAVHLLIITAFLVLKIRTIPAQEFAVMIDLSQIVFDFEEEISPEAVQAQEEAVTQELMQAIRQEMRNIPVNVVDQRAAENIERMRREILAEENLSDPEPYQEPPVNTPADDATAANIYDDRFPVDAAGGRTVYRGPTTVSYELAGRRHTSMPPPVYRCRSGGTIVVDIVVNNNGYVVRADVNPSRSNSEDPCLVSTAQSYAERSRFNNATTTRQEGTITYVFQAQ